MRASFLEVLCCRLSFIWLFTKGKIVIQILKKNLSVVLETKDAVATKEVGFLYWLIFRSLSDFLPCVLSIELPCEIHTMYNGMHESVVSESASSKLTSSRTS